MDAVLICYCSFEIFELYHIFKGFIWYFFVGVLSSILLMTLEHILCFFIIYF